MKIIRDNELGGIAMIPLFFDWKVRRCNVKDCREQPSTIVVEEGQWIAGFCEAHYQEANAPDGAHFEMEWDDFDAFAPTQLAVVRVGT